MNFTVEEIMKKMETDDAIEVSVDGITFVEELCFMGEESDQPKTILLKGPENEYIVLDFCEEHNHYEPKAITNEVAQQLLSLFPDDEE